MTSNPTIQIAYALLNATTTTDRADLRRQAQELARLLNVAEICSACWQMASNGTAGRMQHEQDTLCVWGNS